MAFTDVIKPGDKIDIRLLQQIENAAVADADIKLYKSQVQDIHKDGQLEIDMPTEGTKLILLPLNVRLELVFYSGSVLYRCIGQIIERYKRDNRYILKIELKTRPEKFQRREFYRYECSLDFTFYELTKEQMKLETEEEIFRVLEEEKIPEREHKGIIVDISGGGIRFSSECELEENMPVLAAIHLSNKSMNKEFHIIGTVISCRRIENSKDKRNEMRMKFMIKDSKVREEIIRYIFEEERLTRQKVKG